MYFLVKSLSLYYATWIIWLIYRLEKRESYIIRYISACSLAQPAITCAMFSPTFPVRTRALKRGMVAPQSNRQGIYRKVKQIKMYSAGVLPKNCVWAQSLGSDFAYRSIWYTMYSWQIRKGNDI
ncbi:hypothetical protein AFLA_011280 [Aspergillus flavus NRRL3357]|nr:hypothetical protein AFLA_011280 [Aspergillus flavus NRRL3357]